MHRTKIVRGPIKHRERLSLTVWYGHCLQMGKQFNLGTYMSKSFGGKTMKKSLIYFVMSTLLAAMFIFAAPTSSEAQSAYYRKKVYRNGRVTWVRVPKPSYYRRHRNRINMAVGTGAGALIGGLIGGKKGALIGAGSGLAGSALYTYKLNPKKRKYRKVRRY